MPLHSTDRVEQNAKICAMHTIILPDVCAAGEAKGPLAAVVDGVKVALSMARR